MKRIIKRNKGFTLIEIMIVVLIIGILLAVAVPNFVKSRQTSQKKACVANLKQIDAAKEQWAMENPGGGAPDAAAITPYIKGADTNFPTCPTDGAAYTIGALGTNPTCPNGAALDHVLP